MKINRIVLLSVGFLAVGSSMVLSRSWSVAGSSPAIQENQVAAASRGEMTKPERKPDTLIANAAPVALGAQQARVSLKASKSGESLGATLRSLAESRGVYLIIGDMSAAEQPGVPYQIFFDLSPGAKAAFNSPHYVGIITFFNAVKLEGADPTSKDTRFYSFDITEIVRNLQSKKLLSDDPTVTFKPAGVPSTGARAEIRRIEVVAR